MLTGNDLETKVAGRFSFVAPVNGGAFLEVRHSVKLQLPTVRLLTGLTF